MLLAIDTAGAACSVALIADDGSIKDERHELVGRGHAEHLMPMIRDMMADRRAEAIAVDCGPGSFTGLRVGIAAARGLGLGWSVPVTGFSSMPLLAAAGFARFEDTPSLGVVMQGGHGQLFVALFSRAPFGQTSALQSLTPEDAVKVVAGQRLIIGSGAEMLAGAMASDRDVASLRAVGMDMRGADLRLLGREWWQNDPRPVYGRAPDAKPKAA